MMKTEGIECLEGELLLVKLQNASCEGLDGKVQHHIQTLLFVDVLGLSFFLPRKVFSSLPAVHRIGCAQRM